MADEMEPAVLKPDEYEPVIIDLDGEQFELIDTAELEGKVYAALTPYSEDDEADDIEFIILEVIDDENGEECTLKTVDDDELYSKIGDKFLELFEQEFDEEEE